MDDTPNEHLVECIFRGLDPVHNALKPYSGGISMELYPAIRAMNVALDDEIDRIAAGVWDRGSSPAGRKSYVRGYLDSLEDVPGAVLRPTLASPIGYRVWDNPQDCLTDAPEVEL